MYPKALNFITILPRGIFWVLFCTERKTTTIIDRNSVLNIYATASPHTTTTTTIDTALNTTIAMTHPQPPAPFPLQQRKQFCHKHHKEQCAMLQRRCVNTV
jgi:hypothetical protein